MRFLFLHVLGIRRKRRRQFQGSAIAPKSSDGFSNHPAGFAFGALPLPMPKMNFLQIILPAIIYLQK